MEEEISLRELIEVLLKGKWLIAIIMVVVIVFTGVASFIFVKPTYNATAVLLTSPIEGNKNDLSGNIDSMIDAMGQYPDMTVETYKQQFINPTVLSQTIGELDLVDEEGNPMARNVLAGKISVSTVDSTNLLRVVVSDGDPALAAQIANELSGNFIRFISHNTKKLGEKATAIIEEQMSNEEAKLEEQAKILQEYLNKSRSVDQMKLEIASLHDQITSYKSSLNSVEKQIASDWDTLEVLTYGEDAITDINDILVNIPLDTATSTQELQLNISDSNELQKALLTIKATEVETRLVQNISEQTAIQGKITDMENKVDELQSDLTEEEYKYNAILRNYNLAEQTYNAYLDRHKEAVIAAASDVGESAIIISSEAVEPLRPAGQGKKMYVAIGAVLGLMIGVFVAFFRAYWKASDPKNKEASK